METYYYSQFNNAVVHVALFDDVTNAAAIRSRIVRAARNLSVDGDTEREAVNFAFIDARLVGMSTPVLTNCY
jgi:EKC/KEOPS complex subunit CGI121/TPRKB